MCTAMRRRRGSSPFAAGPRKAGHFKPLPGRVPTVLQRGPHQDLKAPRDLDKIMSSLGSMPRILCWKCRKLTPFELDRCEHCGSAFAGSTGGVYGSERKSRSRTTSAPKASSTPPKRTLLEIVEDLRHVNEGTTS